jgi:hypothetical protein
MIGIELQVGRQFKYGQANAPMVSDDEIPLSRRLDEGLMPRTDRGNPLDRGDDRVGRPNARPNERDGARDPVPALVEDGRDIRAAVQWAAQGIEQLGALDGERERRARDEPLVGEKRDHEGRRVGARLGERNRLAPWFLRPGHRDQAVDAEIKGVRAIVLMSPVVALTSRITSSPKSAMKMSPRASIETPTGSFSSAPGVGPPSPE